MRLDKMLVAVGTLPATSSAAAVDMADGVAANGGCAVQRESNVSPTASRHGTNETNLWQGGRRRIEVGEGGHDDDSRRRGKLRRRLAIAHK